MAKNRRSIVSVTKADNGEMLSRQKKFLLDCLQEWQREIREDASRADFARYLGFNEQTFSKYFNGERPMTRRAADLFAAKRGPEIYEVLDIPQPDWKRQQLDLLMDNMSEAGKDELLTRAEGILKREGRANARSQNPAV